MDHYQYDPESKNDNNSNNSNNSNNNNYNNNNNTPERKDKIATASLVCGILVIPGTFTLWFGIIFGISAIALAIISRLNTGKFNGRAAAGITLGIVFVILSFMMYYFALKMLSNPDLLDFLNKYMESMK